MFSLETVFSLQVCFQLFVGPSIKSIFTAQHDHTREFILTITPSWVEIKCL